MKSYQEPWTVINLIIWEIGCSSVSHISLSYWFSADWPIGDFFFFFCQASSPLLFLRGGSWVTQHSPLGSLRGGHWAQKRHMGVLCTWGVYFLWNLAMVLPVLQLMDPNIKSLAPAYGILPGDAKEDYRLKENEMRVLYYFIIFYKKNKLGDSRILIQVTVKVRSSFLHLSSVELKQVLKEEVYNLFYNSTSWLFSGLMAEFVASINIVTKWIVHLCVCNFIKKKSDFLVLQRTHAWYPKEPKPRWCYVYYMRIPDHSSRPKLPSCFLLFSSPLNRSFAQFPEYSKLRKIVLCCLHVHIPTTVIDPSSL